MLNPIEEPAYTKWRQQFTKRYGLYRQFHAKYVNHYDLVTNILVKKYELKYKSSFYLLSAIQLFIDRDLNRAFGSNDLHFVTNQAKASINVRLFYLRHAGLIEIVRYGYERAYVMTELALKMLTEFSSLMNDFELKREITINSKYIIPSEPHHMKRRVVYVPSSVRGRGKTFYSKGKISHIVYGDEEKTTSAVIFVKIAGHKSSYPYYPRNVYPANWIGVKGNLSKAIKLRKKKEAL